MIDVQNIRALKTNACDHQKLLDDMTRVAYMVVKKYRYPQSLVEDVVSESIVFMLTHIARIPEEDNRVHSYVISLSKGLFRKFLFNLKDEASEGEREYRLKVVGAVFREVDDISDFCEVVGKVFCGYCFHHLIASKEFKISVESVSELVNRSSYRRLILNVHNRLRYNKVNKY